MSRPDLIAEYARQARLGQFLGLTILRYERELKALCELHHARTILDYGSGHGKAWVDGLDKRLGLSKLIRYDPAIPAFARKPTGQFDGVVCVDVLEHVPREEVDALIEELFRYATKFVFATVCCRPAKKLFPWGENMHVTIEPLDWWTQRFERIGSTAISDGIQLVLMETP